MSKLACGLAIAIAAAALPALSACREEKSEEPPLLPERNMFDQERLNPEAYSDFFGDHRTMRSPVVGTIAREQPRDLDESVTGLNAAGEYVLTIPPTMVSAHGDTEKMVKRGQERFNIYCVPCHDASGTGKGMVAREPNGFPPLPSFHDPRIRQMPDGEIFATMSNGLRNMPSYAAQIPAQDRWAIVSYIRALEMTQLNSEPKQ